MNTQRVIEVSKVVALAVLSVFFGLGMLMAEPPVPEYGSEGFEVLTRGPVHEAFAETVSFDPRPGIILASAPPAGIEELPPEQKPEGTNVAWIPGYWAWDDDSDNFLWVSGIWRALPPGRQWVSGYWAESGNRVQWISGYWADAQLTEVEYLPEPPQSVEVGPNIAAPSVDSIWLPGSWVWQQHRYAWRPGFWSTVQPNWVWVPTHYLWSPRGYVCVDGYWDYVVARRGVLFAPVSFNQNVYARRGYTYTPSTVIDLAVFASHLFLRPNYGHYYFGDYYGANYANTGYLPSYLFNSGRYGYDPIYSYQRWDNRDDRDWERRVRSDFQYRRDHEDARPPRTFAAQQELGRTSLPEQYNGRVFARPLEQFTKAEKSPWRFQQVDRDERQRFGQLSKEVQNQREERQKLESKGIDPTAKGPSSAIEPTRVKIPKSPLVDRRSEAFSKGDGPPKTHVFPEADPSVVPKPRVRESRGEIQENPIGRVQESPEGRVQENSKGRVQENPKGRVQENPKGRVQESPKGRVQESPKGRVQESPKGQNPKGRVQENLKDPVQENPQGQNPNGRVRENPKDPVQETPKGRVQESPKGPVQENPQGQNPNGRVRENPNGRVRENPKGRVQESPKGRVQENPKGRVQENPKGRVQENPKGRVQENPKGRVQENPKGRVQESPKGRVQENPKSRVQEKPQGSQEKSKGNAREKPRGASQEKPKSAGQEKPKGSGEDKPKL